MLNSLNGRIIFGAAPGNIKQFGILGRDRAESIAREAEQLLAEMRRLVFPLYFCELIYISSSMKCRYK